jgi:hypothetical protein
MPSGIRRNQRPPDHLRRYRGETEQMSRLRMALLVIGVILAGLVLINAFTVPTATLAPSQE